MATVTWQELRDRTDAILAAAAAGDEVEITVDGRPVAILHQAGRRPRYLSREAFVQRVLAHQADSRLRAELRDLAPDTTD
jgi:antitoxin (DNA-binding transcriptional repressor) of toxin-antitoxin stability system